VWPIFAQGGEYGPKYDVIGPNYDVISPDDVRPDNSWKRSRTFDSSPAIVATKKDLESLLHQADPSLTVQALPVNPRINFRKGKTLDILFLFDI
jgi:hypothetical protein